MGKKILSFYALHVFKLSTIIYWFKQVQKALKRTDRASFIFNPTTHTKQILLLLGGQGHTHLVH